MIVPSIDLQGGQAVQLIGGEAKAIDAGDPLPIAERFAIAGEIAVIDLDAAMRRGSNAALVESLVQRFPCRVGGGIRDVDTAIGWLDRGASKIILGTMAKPEILEKLPRDRVIAALDARNGEIVVEGWQQGTGQGVLEQIARLKDLVAGFLVTFVEREGRMQGTDLERAQAIVEAAKPAQGDDRRRHHDRRGDQGARCHRRRRAGRHGALHRPPRARRRHHGAAA